MNCRPPARSDTFRFCCLALCAVGSLLLTLTLLSGCGGNSAPLPDPGSVSVDAPPPEVEPPAIELAAELSTVKRLSLRWSAPGLELPQRALILEDPDGNGPLPAEQLAEVASADGAATVEIFLPTALQASYRVSLCNGGQCVASAPLQLGGSLERYAGRIKAEMPQAGAGLGEALSLSRDARVLAITALYESVVVPGAREGAVHLYERVAPGQWMARGQVAAPNPGHADQFGAALALSRDGQVLVVGAPNEDAQGSGDAGLNDLASNAGAAYVYRRSGDQWVFSAYLKGSEIGNGARFGSALDISDDAGRIAVGAPKDSGGGFSDGAVYEFVDDQGTWTQTRIFRDGNSTAGEDFGAHLALNGDGSVLVIGSPLNASSGSGVQATPIDDAGAPQSGAVHVYRRSGAAWTYEAFIKPPVDLGTGQFGHWVDVDADGVSLIVSAPEADLDTQDQLSSTDITHWNSGRVLVLSRTNGNWAHEAMLRQPHPRGEDSFGWVARLSADGQTVVVGSYNQDTQGSGFGADESVADTDDFGAGYVFQREAGGWSVVTVLKPSDRGDAPASKGLWFGRSVAVSGDGRTIAIGAPGHDGPDAGISADPTLSYPFDISSGNTGAAFLY